MAERTDETDDSQSFADSGAALGSSCLVPGAGIEPAVALIEYEDRSLLAFSANPHAYDSSTSTRW